MRWVVVCVFFVLIGTVEIDTDEKWKQYKSEYNKTFTSQEEEDTRRLIWENNLKYIRQHNLEADIGLHSYRLGVNAFADLSPEEFRQQRTGLLKTSSIQRRSSFGPVRKVGSLPTEIDWRTLGYVTSVKNQGNCGSCYAFSAVGCVEGQYFKSSDNLISLSAQEIIDCSTAREGDYGCAGGVMTGAFKFMMDKGIESEEIYPEIESMRSGTCEYEEDMVVTTVLDYFNIESGNEDALQEAVAMIGPVSVGIYVDDNTFQFYESGVYDNAGCDNDYDSLNHAVLTVGYGETGGNQYWIVKNSWGVEWGDAGYILMSRNKDNQCGIATLASYALV